MSQAITPFEQIRRTNPAGNEFWSSRDFARVLGYNDYRNFEAVIAKAKTACFNSGQRLEDHFVDITDMIGIGKGGQLSTLNQPASFSLQPFFQRPKCGESSPHWTKSSLTGRLSYR